jgi:hypothetical protein
MNTEKLIIELADAFCRWPLPDSVCADRCATTQGPGRTGTNLLSVVEARAMFTDMLPIITSAIEQARGMTLGGDSNGPVRTGHVTPGISSDPTSRATPPDLHALCEEVAKDGASDAFCREHAQRLNIGKFDNPNALSTADAHNVKVIKQAIEQHMRGDKL